MKQFLIIGSGWFGSSLAKALCDMGHEVMCIDNKEESVEAIADYVTQAVQADATDLETMRKLGVGNMDVAVIAIGEDMSNSVLATLCCKELGIKQVWAKAADDMHAKVLKKIGADKVIFPERDMGIRVAYSLSASNVLDYIDLSAEHRIVEIIAVKKWVGHTLRELAIRSKYEMTIIAVKGEDKMVISPSGDYMIEDNDVLVIVSSIEGMKKMERAELRE